MELLELKQENLELKEQLAIATQRYETAMASKMFQRGYSVPKFARFPMLLLWNVYFDDVDNIQNVRPWGRVRKLTNTAQDQALYEVSEGDLDEMIKWCKDHDIIEIN
jgi:hypothetical protein